MDDDFGGFVRRMREHQGLDLAALAEALGRDKSYVSRLETGRNKQLPTPAEMDRIAAAIKVSVADLLRAAGYDVTAGDKPLDLARRASIRQLVPDLDALSDTQFAHVVELVAMLRGRAMRR